MRRPLFFATWKSNKTPKEVLEFYQEVYKRGLELKNKNGQIRLTINCDRNFISDLIFLFFFITIYNDTPIRRYRILQKIGNNIEVGASGGLIKIL